VLASTGQDQGGAIQLKILNKQASALMRMYGNSGGPAGMTPAVGGGGRRQQIKSVERKPHPVVAAAGYTTNYQMYHPQAMNQIQHITQSNSKLAASNIVNSSEQT
jgi:hypothetical protein